MRAGRCVSIVSMLATPCSGDFAARAWPSMAPWARDESFLIADGGNKARAIDCASGEVKCEMIDEERMRNLRAYGATSDWETPWLL